MKGPQAVGAAILVLALSGCIGGPDSVRPVVDLPIAADAPWERLLLTTHGEAGDWVLVSQPLSGVTGVLTLDVEMELTIHGDGAEWAALVMQPGAALTQPDSDEMRFTPRMMFRHGAEAETITAAGTHIVGREGSGVVFHSVLFGVAATAPWTLKLVVHLQGASGPDIYPETVLHGNGTTFTVGGERAMGLPNAPAGHIELQAVTEQAGWTHVGTFAVDQAQRVGVQRATITFANGRDYSDPPSRETIIDTPVYSTSSPSSMVEHWGDLANSAGVNSLQATYARTAGGAQAFFMHMPGAQDAVPDGLVATSYFSRNH